MRYFSTASLARHMSHTTIKPRHPLITILGATGTGKSELAVCLARKLNGEVINGDALQLYEGLPIVTNKITDAEQHGIKHHLLGTVPLTEPTWTVSQFTNHASRIIEDVRARGKIPILVGGTHYYLQSTLFKDVLVENTNKDVSDGEVSGAEDEKFLSVHEQEAKWPILAAGHEAIRAELQRVDPVMANRWHPKDERKTRRSLVIYLQTGRPASEIYAEQAKNRERLAHPQEEEQSTTTEDAVSSLRYDNLLLWTYTELETLDTRLSNRVDKMLARGLLNEIKFLNDFRLSQEHAGKSVDTTRGIWVAIGYKEYAQYLSTINNSTSPPSASEIEASLAYGKERTFISTRQYARYQIKWIRHKLMPLLSTTGILPRLFLLDSTDTTHFPTTVEQIATDLATTWLSGTTLPKPEEVSEFAAKVLASMEQKDFEERAPRTCEMCGVTVMLERDWERHVKSSKHRRGVKRRLQKARNPRFAAAARERAGENDAVEPVSSNEDVGSHIVPGASKTELDGHEEEKDFLGLAEFSYHDSEAEDESSVDEYGTVKSGKWRTL